jgi:hypothetical protein
MINCMYLSHEFAYVCFILGASPSAMMEAAFARLPALSYPLFVAAKIET